MRLWALRAALQIPHFANALVRDDNPMSCGAALASADEASIPRWFEVAGGEFLGTPPPATGRGGGARPPPGFFFGGRRAGTHPEGRPVRAPPRAGPPTA